MSYVENKLSRQITTSGSRLIISKSGSSGPMVILVHSSVSGARQWRRLMDDLKNEFRVRAVNLFGYGKTPPWPTDEMQTLNDQARLVEAAIPPDVHEIYLVGHSFGGSVAMKVAARWTGNVARLVLLETNPFYLLDRLAVQSTSRTRSYDDPNGITPIPEGRSSSWPT